MSNLTDNQLHAEYQEHFFAIRKFGFDTRDENVGGLVKYLIDYYYSPDSVHTDQEYEDGCTGAYDDGYLEGHQHGYAFARRLYGV